ncbi:MAG: type I glyceraldehyde-3-phosphate dehydrogenase [Pseudomonadota bacterium]
MKVAINGFGRIGRCVLRILDGHKDIEVVQINDITDVATLAHLLRYDSVHGQWNHKVGIDGNNLIAGDRRIEISAVKDPSQLPWKAKNVDVVLECTGLFRDRAKASAHLEAGAKHVVISAPGKEPDATFCMGINHLQYDPAQHKIISNASCTTNCLAPMAKTLHEKFGIVKALMTTIHSYTNDQRILDLPHKDLRRARAAMLSMIPTTTGAAKAVGLVLPELKGKIDGLAIRVPTPNVSLVDLTAELGKDTSVEEVNAALRSAADGALKGIMDYTEEPIVSNDLNDSTVSCTVDADMTKVIEKRLVKVFGWYDNEWGYSSRMVDLIEYMRKVGV